MALAGEPGWGVACTGPGRMRALTLDVGKTLLYPSRPVGTVYSEIAARLGMEICPELAEERFHAAWAEVQQSYQGLVYGRTHAEAKAFWVRVVGAVMARVDGATDAAVATLVGALYDTFSCSAAWRVHPGWACLLNSCRSRGVRVGLISNWDRRLRGLLGQLCLLDVVDSTVISAEHGVEKPDRAIFNVSLSELGVDRPEVIHVGDTWEEDVLGAVGAGMGAVWLNPERRPRSSDHPTVPEIHDLGELGSLLSLC